jgi:hypothetical protein
MVLVAQVVEEQVLHLQVDLSMRGQQERLTLVVVEVLLTLQVQVVFQAQVVEMVDLEE